MINAVFENADTTAQHAQYRHRYGDMAGVFLGRGDESAVVHSCLVRGQWSVVRGWSFRSDLPARASRIGRCFTSARTSRDSGQRTNGQWTTDNRQMKTPDALMLPETSKRGARMVDRVASIADIAEPLLEVDRERGERAYIRTPRQRQALRLEVDLRHDPFP